MSILEIKYLCKFDEEGNRTETYVTGIHFTDETDEFVQQKLADGFIWVSDEDYQYYVGNKGQGDNGTGYIRDSTTGKPISAPARVITLEEQANALKSACDTDIQAIDNAIDVATKNNNTERVAELQEMRQQRIQQYANELENLTNET